MRPQHLTTLLLILVMILATVPSAVSAACSAVTPTLPEVVIVDIPEPSPPVARVPLKTREVNGEVRLENVYGTPEIINPRFRPTLEMMPMTGSGSACWRLIPSLCEYDSLRIPGGP